MADNLPLYVAIGLALTWGACIAYGTSSLYRSGSPLFIIYVGSWICFYLWYTGWKKEHPGISPPSLISIITFLALILAVLSHFFGNPKPPKQRYTPQ